MESLNTHRNARYERRRLPRRVLMTADTIGGVWQYAIDLARGLTHNGIEVVLAAMGGRASVGQREAAAAVDGLSVLDSDYKLEWMTSPWYDVAEAGAWLLDLAADVDPDLVHLNNFAHGALAWERPVLMVGHSCVYSWFHAVEHRDPPAEWHRYRIEVSRGLAAADAVTAPSETMLKALRKYYGRYRRISPIHNGTEAGLFRPDRKERLVFGAGRLWDAAKNLATLDSVAEQIMWPVFVAGATEHPDGGIAEFKAARALGLLNRSEMRSWLGRAPIYVLPARYEPFGLSALEAALSGCALVLGDIPSLHEVWGDAATYVDPLDPGALRDAVNDLIADEERLLTNADRVRRRARHFSLERMVSRYLEAYAELYTAAPRSRRRNGWRRPQTSRLSGPVPLPGPGN